MANDFNWIKDLPNLDKSKTRYSQFSEDIIIDNIFENIGTTNKVYVDIGAGAYGGDISNTKKLKYEQEWTGFMFDMNVDNNPGIIKAFVTPYNVCQLLTENDCPREFDFLNVDLDSFDYDIIDSILGAFNPRLVCAEFNGTLPVDSTIKLAYEDGYTWDGTNKYGFSFGAGKHLFEKHGYTVIMNHINMDLFAVRNDALPLEAINSISITAEQTMYHPVNNSAVWVEAD